MSTIAATRIGIDLTRNEIRIEWPAAVSAGLESNDDAREVVVDIGQRGRLLGIDLGDAYVTVAPEAVAADPLARSTRVEAMLTTGSATIQAVIPRRGGGYEISWPSGNQCWQQPAGAGTVTTCVVTVD